MEQLSFLSTQQPRPQGLDHTKMGQQFAHFMSSASTTGDEDKNEWYTPAPYVESAREVMGGIDCDPASNAVANGIVKATLIYTKAENGLSKDWPGRVWANPPWDKSAKWAATLMGRYNYGLVGKSPTTEFTALVGAAQGYNWYTRMLKECYSCLMYDRIAFWSPTFGFDKGLHPKGTTFFYMGPNSEAFMNVFTIWGRVLEPEMTDQERIKQLILGHIQATGRAVVTRHVLCDAFPEGDRRSQGLTRFAFHLTGKTPPALYHEEQLREFCMTHALELIEDPKRDLVTLKKQ